MHLVLAAAAVAAAEDPVHCQPSAQSGHLLSQQYHCCSPTITHTQRQTVSVAKESHNDEAACNEVRHHTAASRGPGQMTPLCFTESLKW